MAARSCALTSLECSQNSVKEKKKKEKTLVTCYHPQVFLRRRSERGAWTLVRKLGDEHGARAGDDGKPK